MGRDREIRRTTAQAIGGDSNALLKLYSLDPRTAMGIEDQLHQRSERQREGEYRGALGDYLTSQGGSNALMRYAPQPGNAMMLGNSWGQPPVARDPLAPLPDSSNATAGGGGLTARTAAPYSTPGIGDGLPGNRPAGGAMDARSRAIRANPEGFLTFEGKRLQVNEGQLKLLKGVSDFGMQLLGGVYDQASYDAAKQQAAAVYQQHGLELPQLPPQYSPEVVNGLRLQGMETDKQLLAIARENKLDWDIQDDIGDNESLNDYRQGQLAIALRGQDIASGDRRRGQDMTDRRVRGSAAYQGRGGKGGRGGGARAVLNGQTIVVRGGKWVYEKSGQPVE